MSVLASLRRRLISSRLPGRLLIVGTLAALGLTIGAGVASAHVTVEPNTAAVGSYPALTFRVPNESAQADTVKLTVNFPLDHPFASVSIRKQPGWTTQVTTTTLRTPISDDDNAGITAAVSSITWTADASAKISLGQFAAFEVVVGPVPKVKSLAFDIAQTYDDGTVVKWDEATPASGAEPENPAPVLTVSPAALATGSDPIPADPIPAGTVPAGTIPADPIPAGTVPAGTIPAGTIPAGTIPAGTIPAGTVPAVTVPAVTVTAMTGTGTAAPTITSAAGAGAAATVTSTPVAVPAAAASVSVGADSAARWLGVIGILVGAIGLLTAAVALRARPRTK